MELDEEKKNKKKRDFNLTAMKELIDEKSFLKSKYEKLSVNAMERFGYHWNEVICNVLYNKYVKGDKDLLERYNVLKVRNEKEKDNLSYDDIRPDIKIDKKKVTEETNSFLTKKITESNIGFYAQVLKNGEYFMGCKGPQSEEKANEWCDNIINKYNKDTKMKKINEMSSGGGNSVGSDIPTGNGSGAYETPVAWSGSNKARRFFKNTLIKGSKIVNDGTPDNTLTNEETLSGLLEDFTQMMNGLEPDIKSNDSQPNVLSYHIVTNNDNDFYADVRDSEGKTIFDIDSLDAVNTLISDGVLSSKEDIDGLSKLLKSQNLMASNDVLEIAEINEGDKPFVDTNVGVVMEEVKPNGLVQAERIKAVNTENSLNYYKTLNDGIQDMIKIEKPVNVAIEATIKYDYDNNDGAKVVNGVFPEEGKYNDEFKDTAHRGMEDWELDRPDDKYDERLKKMVGTNSYNVLKDKQKVIKNKELKNMPAGRFKTVDNTVNESFLSGFYLDSYGNKKIKTTTLSKVKEVDTITEGVKFFETKGVGNAYDESLKEQIENYNFYYELNEGTFIKIPKDKDPYKQKNMLNESAVKKVKYFMGYDPSKNVKNIVDRSKL